MIDRAKMRAAVEILTAHSDQRDKIRSETTPTPSPQKATGRLVTGQ